jgi:superfamily II DNA or RNA helicase
MSNLIDWYKRKMMGGVRREFYKHMYLRMCGDRLKWLSDLKTSFVSTLLDQLKGERTLTFCNGIAQTEVLGTHCVNSKNAESEQNLQDFNSGRVDHITACNMLDEGVNLVNCRVGIYATLNSSDRMITQKLGRLLRHEEPIIIIPYYKYTRDEEIVKKMCENYNPDLVTTINDLTELQI